jgi:hypothetical protein
MTGLFIFVSVKNGCWFVNDCFVSFSVPPTAIMRPRDTSVIQHRPLLLHCEYTGFPTPSLTWLKDSSALNTSHVNILANGSLSIPRTTVNDAGQYSCVADNVAGRAVVNANVVIYGKFGLRQNVYLI